MNLNLVRVSYLLLVAWILVLASNCKELQQNGDITTTVSPTTVVITSKPKTTGATSGQTTNQPATTATTQKQPNTTTGHPKPTTGETSTPASTNTQPATTSGNQTTTKGGTSAATATHTQPATTKGETTATPATSQKPPPPKRKFDVGSFFGGIILALGLCAIAAIIYFCYVKNKSSGKYDRLMTE